MKYKCLEKLGVKDKPKVKSRVLSFFNKMLTAVLICIVCLIIMEYSPKFKTFMNEDVLGGFFFFFFGLYWGFLASPAFL